MLTDKEKEMLINIVENNFSGNHDPEECQVWSNCLMEGPFDIPETSIPGRVGSLVKKGLVRNSGEGTKDCTVYLTPAGVTAYRELFNEEEYNQRHRRN